MREILKKHNFRFKKKWGQNFIFEQNLLQRIVREAGIVPGDRVVEIGAGAGTLTRELLAQGAQVLAIEIDHTLLPLLESLFPGEKVVFVQGDVLQMDLDKLTYSYGWKYPYKVVANLPYYITTPLVMKLLEKEKEIEDIVVMMQKEVAERLLAAPGTKEYGAITLAVQYYAEIEMLFPVSRHAFRPVPKVDSTVIRLKPRKEPPVQVRDEVILFKIIKAAFGQRRKTLLNSLLKVQPSVEKEAVREVLTQAEIDFQTRGEGLSLEQFAVLSNVWVENLKTMV
ncbi:MAG: 16S rRNA (adenine(1518)-N(6)/adenine(1519)-N(6))-dimethyltransferase RsmA [Peptococcia bacterium]